MRHCTLRSKEQRIPCTSSSANVRAATLRPRFRGARSLAFARARPRPRALRPPSAAPHPRLVCEAGRGCALQDDASRAEPSPRLRVAGGLDRRDRGYHVAPRLWLGLVLLNTPRARHASTSRGESQSFSASSTVSGAAGLGGVGFPVGVPLKRGAGAGCTTPSTSTKLPRSLKCACPDASANESTGAKQTSVPSSSAHHSARVRVRTRSATAALAHGQAERSYCDPSSAASMPS